MDIMELGAIGELVGGVAVIATLFYLATQIRQNTQSTRFLATQSMIKGQAEANLVAAAHGDLAAILNVGVMADSEEELTPKERHRFNIYLIGFYVQVDFAYHQYLAGRLEKSVWMRMQNEIPAFFHLPGMARWWAQDKQRFSPEFVEFVEHQISTTKLPEVIPTMGREASDTHEGEA